MLIDWRSSKVFVDDRDGVVAIRDGYHREHTRYTY